MDYPINTDALVDLAALHVEVNNQHPADWLKLLGAIHPQAVVGDFVLVLGRWHKGYYPIQFTGGKTSVKKGKRVSAPDQWRLFGRLIEEALTRDEVEAILEQLK